MVLIISIPIAGFGGIRGDTNEETMFTSMDRYLGLTLKDRYRLERFLGEGLRGLAFLAYDSLLEGWVVVKIIKDEIEGFPVPVGDEWIEEPKKAMQVRSHPHIAAILDLGDEIAVSEGEKARLPFIVWEYIKGISLDDIINSDEELSLPELLVLAKQFCETLIFLKEKKLSHGDLHPRNVMLLRIPGGGTTIKLIDFGMARNILTAKARQDDITGALKILGQLVEKALSGDLPQDELSLGTSLRDHVRRASNLMPAGKMSMVDFAEGIGQLNQYCFSSKDCVHIIDGLKQLRSRDDNAGYLPDFFGRRREVDAILETAGKAFTHRFTRRILLLGEPGSGKTVALRETADGLTRSSDAIVLSYNVNPSDHQKPYSSLGGFWKGLITKVDGKNRLERILDEFPHVRPHFHARLPGLLSLFSADRLTGTGGMLLSDLAVELKGLINDAAKLIPLAIIFDDLHAADIETIRWLLGFKTGEAGFSLAMIFAHSPCELNFISSTDNHPLKVLQEDDYSRIVTLSPLAFKDIEDTISSEFTFGVSMECTKFTEFVMDESGGEPYCVREIVKECVSKGIISSDPYGRWHIQQGLDGFILPPNVEAHVARRLMRLNQSEMGLVKWAAYFGTTFPAEGLRAVSGMGDEEFSATINSLGEFHHLLRRQNEETWVFTQPTVRKILLKGIPFAERNTGLETVTEWQVERAKMLKRPSFLVEVARNLFVLERDKQARGFAAAGARGYLRAREYDKAFAAAELALSSSDDSKRRYPHPGLQVVAYQAGLESSIHLARFDDALTASNRLLQLAEETGDIELKLNASLKKALALRLKCDYTCAAEQIGEAAKLARKYKKPKFEGEVLRELGTVRYLKGEFEKAIDAFTQSAELLDKLGEEHSAAKTYNNLGLVYKQMGDYAPMEECLRTAIAKYRAAGDKAGERLPLANLGLYHQQVGKYDEAKRCFEDILEQLEPGENPVFEAKASLSLALVKTSIGLSEDAAKMAEQALLLFTEMNDKQGQAETMSLLGDIAIDNGNYNLAKEYHKRSLKLKEEIGSEMGICHSKLRLARVAMHEAKFDIALSLSREVSQRARKKGWTKLTIEGITETIRALSERDGSDAALKVLEDNRGYEGMVGDPAIVLLDFNLAAAQTYFDSNIVEDAARHLNAFEEYYSSVLNSIKDPEVRDGFSAKMQPQLSIAHELREKMFGVKDKAGN